MNKVLMWILIGLGILVVSVAGFVVSASTVMIKKPAVYLYPENDMMISVNLNVNGKIINDIPKYNNGWEVYTTKEGIIENKYDYLFYEAKLKTIDIPEEGWIVEYSELNNWFDFKLEELGLNKKEIFQFKEYWMEELPEANYYEIKLLSEEFLKENMDLIITPKPDTLIRLNFLFKELPKAKIIQEHTIITPERKGFVVVEWGGIII